MGKAALVVRPPTDAEREALEAALRSSDAFVLRRAQIVLASAQGEGVGVTAPRVGCTGQAVRRVVQACNVQGLAVLQRGSSRPHTIYVALDASRAEALRALPQRSPRDVDKPTSVWTLALAAAVAQEQGQGLTAERVSGETIRATLARLGVRWRRAKEWITRPDPEYARKKARRDRLIRLAQQHPEGLLGCEDEVWWSRLARPALPAWQDDAPPLRLIERTVARDDPAPKALACDGLLARWWDDPTRRSEEMGRRFVAGRPVSTVTIAFPRWGAAQAAARGKRAVLLVWDNASWHDSQIVRHGVRPHHRHHRQVTQAGNGVRLLVSALPIKSPWLNPIEPTWLHGKRRIVEPARLLPAHEVAARVCAAFACPHEPHLVAPAPAPPKRKKTPVASTPPPSVIPFIQSKKAA